MRDLRDLKLVNLAESELSNREMAGLKGGYFCVCGACGRYGYTDTSNSYRG